MHPMKVLGIRFCKVDEHADELARFLGPEGLGLVPMEGFEASASHEARGEPGTSFDGAVFTAGDGSWVEVWQPGPGMPPGVMLQIVVDDADAYADYARTMGLSPRGPMDAHGERIYYIEAPTGLPISFQSRLAEGAR
jgi:hypothetical protein